MQCVSGARFRPLHLDLLNRKQRVEDRRGNRFHAPVVIGDTDDEYLNDAETFVFVSGIGELRPPYIGRSNHAAGGRIMRFSGDDTSQWAQERLNRSKIGKASAWE